MIGPGPYRATKLWNETVRLFRSRMPVRRRWSRFRSFERCFSGSEALDFLHQLLRQNQNFGPEVSRRQTLQLLGKFLKNHVIEDVRGRFGTEDFQDSGHLYRFPPRSPLKTVPVRPPVRDLQIPTMPCWEEEKVPAARLMSSESWNKRHSIAIGELPEHRLTQRTEITQRQLEHIWKKRTLMHLQCVLGLQSLHELLDVALINPKHIVHNVCGVNKQNIVILKSRSEDLPHWVLSAMKCLANWPHGGDSRNCMYPGFERDVFKTVCEYFQSLQEPLLTFRLYEAFVSILGLLQYQALAVEALQVCFLLLPPANRRKLQLLMRLMAKVCVNASLPPLNDTISTRTLMVQTFSRCVLRSAADLDLDDLLSSKLLMFLLDHEELLEVPAGLRKSVEEQITQLTRTQIWHAGSHSDSSAVYCSQISSQQFEQQRVSVSHMEDLLENIMKISSVRERRRRLKQFQRVHPEIYSRRFPADGETRERATPKPVMQALKSRFQRSWSFRS